ncbi:MAG: hypothetical protein HYV53_04190 [Parcubacteria group bacterium]|nr:hypothetical protein [Parcubacteria group bacterium]
MHGVTCPNCKTECSTESHNCRKCGKPLPTVCLRCDAENPWCLVKCQGCGANLLGQELKDEKLAMDAELVEWLKSYLSSVAENVKVAVS